jgi:hypothetical protein
MMYEAPGLYQAVPALNSHFLRPSATSFRHTNETKALLFQHTLKYGPVLELMHVGSGVGWGVRGA